MFKEFESKSNAVMFWILCLFAGFAIPTAIAGWCGWLDPLFAVIK
jgi:hypothetical protein